MEPPKYDKTKTDGENLYILLQYIEKKYGKLSKE